MSGQFYTELGSGYAFSKHKNITTFYYNNEFKKVGNIFRGMFYDFNIGYMFKSKIGLEVDCKYNPKSSNILNNPKSFMTLNTAFFDSYNNDIIFTGPLSFWDGMYLSIIPRILYQRKIKLIDISAGLGIGYNLLNYYSYYKSIKNYSRNNNGMVVYSYYENGEIFNKYSEDYYAINLMLKINYSIYKNVDMFFKANVYLNKPYVFGQNNKSKILYKKIHAEEFDINQNPTTTIIDINEENISLGRSNLNLNYLPSEVYNASNISKLIYTQIGLCYTFGKSDKKG